MDSALDLCAKKPAPLDRQSRAASDRAQPEHQSSKTEFAMAEKVLLVRKEGIITQNYRSRCDMLMYVPACSNNPAENERGAMGAVDGAT
jgi:hypothetical protein